MIPHTMILGADRIISNTNDPSRYFPNNQAEFGMFDSVTFQMEIFTATGSPSAWTHAVKFQYAMEHRTGLGFANPGTWRDLVDADFGSTAWTSPVNTDTTTWRQQRTILRPPAYLRLVITPSYTGGSSPTNPVTVLAICR